MARCLGLVWYLILVVAFLDTATAKDYELNWAIPPDNTADGFYANWTSTEFEIGDAVIFNWTPVHNVANVTEADYENCTKVSSLLGDTPPVKVPLNSSGNFYFICTIGTHCERGQKVSLVVKDKVSNVAPAPGGPSQDKVPNAASALGGLSQVISILVTYFLTYHV